MSDEEVGDDLSREAYCVLGVPIDVIDMAGVLARIDLAVATASPLFLSTPNLNYLVNSRSDAEFRESLVLSDLAPADGMAVVWLGRLLGAPIKERVSGADIFAALKGEHLRGGRPLKLFLFGGDQGVAEAAALAINVAHGRARCVGWRDPGFSSVEELSRDSLVDAINASKADFLVASLGAVKGQLWLKRNLPRLRVPVRAHFGAALNFEAGRIRRAPVVLRKVGLEWAWRIKEEPHLWARYFHDGRILLHILCFNVLPLMTYNIIVKRYSRDTLTVDEQRLGDRLMLSLSGAATRHSVKIVIPVLRQAIASNKRLAIDLARDSCSRRAVSGTAPRSQENSHTKQC